MIERFKNSIQVPLNVLSSMYAGIGDLICMFTQYVFTCSQYFFNKILLYIYIIGSLYTRFLHMSFNHAIIPSLWVMFHSTYHKGEG